MTGFVFLGPRTDVGPSADFNSSARWAAAERSDRHGASAPRKPPPAGQRNSCACAIIQAAPIIVPRFLDTVRQVVGIARVIAVLRVAVVYLGCVLAIALLATGGVGCAGRDDRQHCENAGGNDGFSHDAGPSFAERARVVQYDLRLTPVLVNNSRHADALSL